MKLLFSNHLGDCSYSFSGSVELICITVTVVLFAERSCRKQFPSDFSTICCNYRYIIQGCSKWKCNDFEKNGKPFRPKKNHKWCLGKVHTFWQANLKYIIYVWDTVGLLQWSKGLSLENSEKGGRLFTYSWSSFAYSQASLLTVP